MLAILAIGAALLVPVEASTQHAPRPLPEEWPPLPDFKRTIDYVRWFQEHLNQGVADDDAAALWAEVAESPDDPPEAKKAKAELWGYTEEGKLPGLISGDDPTPDRNAWDPNDHPDWEKAYQAQREHGLHEKLVEASKRRFLSVALRWPEREEMPTLADTNGETLDWGLTADDRLIFTGLMPSLAIHRAAARVLLQNAWRAPGGEVDADAMVGAVQAAIRIGRQVDSDGRTPIGLLVAAAICQLSYDTAIRSLDEGALDAEHAASIERDLARYDRRAFTWLTTQPVQIAGEAELLQFVYAPADGIWPQVPSVNRANAEKLAKFAAACHKASPADWTPPPLDIAGQIDRCNPRDAVQQLTDLHLAVRETIRRQIPLDACPKLDQLYREFRENPANHVILRQFVYDACSGRSMLAMTQREARRRATLLIFALHRVQHETGQWPESLRDRRLRLKRESLTDPFSRKDFIYRVEGGSPLLYSVGYNAKDDGGKHAEWRHHIELDGNSRVAQDVDYVLWPLQRNAK